MCGVPQGSVLGPLLFLIYINDLPNISNKLKFFLFADDTNIYYEDKNTKTIQQVVNTEFKKLVDWLNTNRLALNISKTNFVIFSPPNKPKSNVIILLNKKAIEEKEYVKYLGVLLDSSLSFRYHISALNKKISRAIGVMHKIKYFVDKRILTTLYYSLIYPFLIYAIPIWGKAAEVYMNNILVLQKSAVRIITGNGRNFNLGVLAPSSPLFLQTNILKIHDIFKLQTAKFVFNCLNKISPANFHEYFVLNTNKYNTYATRNELLIKPLVRTTNYGIKSIKSTGVCIWNDTPIGIRESISLKTFSKKYKQHLMISYDS